MKLSHLFFALGTTMVVASSALTACSADAAPVDDAALGESSDELTAAGKALIGAYQDDTGASAASC